MKCLFLSLRNDMSNGSFRLYINNLMNWMERLGVDVELNKENYSDYDVIICDKAYPPKLLSKIKKQTKAVIGIANSIRPNIADYDFVISACQTERCYALKYNQNVLIFPQIEMFDGLKVHGHKSRVSIGYHGNLEHLEQMDKSIFDALKHLSQKYDIELRVIYNMASLGKWKKNRPKDLKIVDVQWTLESITDELLKCDIGIVPNNSNITKVEKWLFFFLQKILHGNTIGNDHDFLLRFKPTTNAGRALVFHQLGIPVVSEIVPDNYAILNNPQNGFIANDTQSWICSLEKLIKNKDLRNNMAVSAKKDFLKLYNPIELTKVLLNDLEIMRYENKN